LLCSYMAIAVLGGLLLNMSFGIWWVDPVVALLIAGFAVKKGRESLRGDACCSTC
jgi:divalent metal cation (Fe/Co/Zn/Cd) transporter